MIQLESTRNLRFSWHLPAVRIEFAPLDHRSIDLLGSTLAAPI
jgi:hypothetical protein